MFEKFFVIILGFWRKNVIWMKDGRIRVSVLGKKVETDGIWKSESHKYAYSSLKALKLIFANILCAKTSQWNTLVNVGLPRAYMLILFFTTFMNPTSTFLVPRWAMTRVLSCFCLGGPKPPRPTSIVYYTSYKLNQTWVKIESSL